MNHKTNLLLTGMLLLTLFVNAQTLSQKELQAKRTTQSVKIDGLITDAAWKDAAIMTDLVEFRPKMGVVEAHDDDHEDRQVEERVAEPEGHEDAAGLAHRARPGRGLELAHRRGRRIRRGRRVSHGAVLP